VPRSGLHNRPLCGIGKDGVLSRHSRDERRGEVARARIIQEWQDAAGGFLRSANWYDDTVGAGGYEAAVQAASIANLQYATGAVPQVGVVTPGTTQYFLCTDTAVLTFQTSPGSSLQVIVPAPDATIFGPDGNTVDPTNATVISLIASVVGVLMDVGGNLATAYKSGVKSSRRTEQNVG